MDEEKAKQAAAILKEFCENTKCQKCIFAGNKYSCELKTLPMDWYLPEGCEIE